MYMPAANMAPWVKKLPDTGPEAAKFNASVWQAGETPPLGTCRFEEGGSMF